MMPANPRYKCTQCSHEFERFEKEGEVRCPRCGSAELEENRFLLGTPSAEGLTYEDYFDTCLAPCCGDARGIGFCQWGPIKEEEKEKGSKPA